MRNLPPVLAGGSAIEKWLNQLRDCVREGFGMANTRQRMIRGPFGWAQLADNIEEVGSDGGKVSQYRVHSVGDDYLVCQKISGSSVDSALVYVAKPFHLRRTPFDGASVTYTIENPPAPNYTVTISYSYTSGTFRTATLGGQSEKQAVIPRFALDRDIIYAAEVQEDTGLTGGDGSAITLVDSNADGRAWAKVL